MKIKRFIGLPKLGILGMILLLFLFNMGCSAKSTEFSRDMAPNMDLAESSSHSEMLKLDGDAKRSSLEPEKVITNVYLTLETLEFEATTNQLGQLISKYNGFVENSNIYSNHHVGDKILKNGQYTVRIPKENVEPFMKDTQGIGNLVSQNTSIQDITKQYYDTESRLNVLKIKEERILALLEKADKIEDVIAIENQLSDIIYQKENLTKSILDMDDKVSYSTVSLNISEVEKLTNGVTKETSFATKLANAWKDSLYFFKIGIEQFIISAIFVLPYLFLIAPFAFIAYKVIQKKNKSNRE